MQGLKTDSLGCPQEDSEQSELPTVGQGTVWAAHKRTGDCLVCSQEDWGQLGLPTGGLETICAAYRKTGTVRAAHRRTTGCSKGKWGRSSGKISPLEKAGEEVQREGEMGPAVHAIWRD